MKAEPRYERDSGVTELLTLNYSGAHSDTERGTKNRRHWLSYAFQRAAESSTKALLETSECRQQLTSSQFEFWRSSLQESCHSEEAGQCSMISVTTLRYRHKQEEEPLTSFH